MFIIIRGDSKILPDVQNFVDIINTLSQHKIREAHSLFDNKNEIFITRAPGRLDVMGGFGDYSGSLVLQKPIKEATLAAMQKRTDGKIKLLSLSKEENRTSFFEMFLDDFEKYGKAISYDSAKAFFKNNQGTHWAAYVAGVFLVLKKEKNFKFKQGANILIHSDVPEGKGVSSSAALEVAAMKAIVSAFSINISPKELAVLCQKVENLIAGAPCGIMDQMTSVFGTQNELMALLCQPAELKEPVYIPEDLTFWGIDSGVRHSIGGTAYGSVRVGTFMGYRILADLAKFEITNSKEKGQVEIHDTLWNGYLSNISTSELEQNYSNRIPLQMSGEEFVNKYHGSTDKVTHILPNQIYNVRVPTSHPVYENFRVNLFAELIQAPKTERSLKLLGELMFQSHAAYSTCGLGSDETDLLVKLAWNIGIGKGLIGAKLTGGGSGGSVALLGKKNTFELVENIAAEYKSLTGIEPYVFKDSSVGAEKFGYFILKKEEV
jgi:galactokinase